MTQKDRVISIAMATIILLSLCAVCASTSVSAADSGSSGARVKASSDLVGAPIPADTGPSAFITKDDHYFYLFVQGYDGALWYNREDLVTPGLPNWGWEGWKSLGGYLTSSPAAASRQDGVINVYVRGANGALYVRQYYNGAWHDWNLIGGYLAPGTGPAASTWTPIDREDVFVVGSTGALWQKTWTAASGWTNWASLGGHLTSTPAVAMMKWAIEVYGRFTDGFLYLNEYFDFSGGFQWNGWSGGSMDGPPGVL